MEMEEYYKISKEEAANVYKEYTDASGIRRVIEANNEQEDGTLLLLKSEYQKIENDVEVQKIDWGSKEVITKEDIRAKPEEISGAEEIKGK